MQFPNDEQSQLIKHYIILPYVLRVFERDQNIIMQSPIKSKEPYLDTFHEIIDRIIGDITQIKKQLRTAGIYLYEQHPDEYSIHYKFKFAGYHHLQSITWHVMRYEVQLHMKKYLKHE